MDLESQLTGRGVATHPNNLRGNLKELYDKASQYAENPYIEIERIAEKAWHEGMIDGRMITILQYTIPFTGEIKESLRELGERFGLSPKTIRQLQQKVGERLMLYLSRQKVKDYTEETSIDALPWDYSNPTHNRARGSLKTYLGQGARIGDVVEHFGRVFREHSYLYWVNYSKKCHQAVNEVFSKAGVRLPAARC